MIPPPPGQIGDWRILHRYVSDEEVEERAWQLYHQYGDRGAKRRPTSGMHVTLTRVSDDMCFMSTQPFELEDNRRFVSIAHGRVLVSGLGLGLILPDLSRKCDHVVVLEKEKDIINLVAPHVDLQNVEIIHADVLNWEPRDGEHFDFAWHDIWATITYKNLPEMVKICRRYKSHVDRQVCWSWDLLIEELIELDTGNANKLLSVMQGLAGLCYRMEDVMPKFRKKPVVIEATQWFKNGDHPYDDCAVYYANDDGVCNHDDPGAEKQIGEGKIVRYFRHPDISGQDKCPYCGRKYHDHGLIDTLEGDMRVCPGDWVITGVQGEHYPCKPDIFEATYEPV